MTTPNVGPRRVRQAVIVLPSLFTLANLFFGVWSIVLASQGAFYRASWFIVIAGVLDMLDGLTARVGRVGTRFGAELDSLVDMTSFGLAPATLIHFQILSHMGPFAWVFSYAFVVCVALRLARYNVQAAGEHKTTFTGLPSPAAGMTLATYYPFTQTGFYQTQLAGLPWSQLVIFLMIALSLAMVSNIRYARLPRIGFRSLRGLGGLAVNLTILGFGIWERDIFFFPLGLTYLTYGLTRAAVMGILERNEQPLPVEQGPALVREPDSPGMVRREPPARGL
ncbi:MAG TPA: CDP-diacylglycerol--serine O-phosphatidyltransferase [Gemmatimonadales bacterium]|nr:CDP-diacylglycerol--serine O-phosphatidyltransferase [Gemmatimonadales bacterium]